MQSARTHTTLGSPRLPMLAVMADDLPGIEALDFGPDASAQETGIAVQVPSWTGVVVGIAGVVLLVLAVWAAFSLNGIRAAAARQACVDDARNALQIIDDVASRSDSAEGVAAELQTQVEQSIDDLRGCGADRTADAVELVYLRPAG